MRKEKLMTDQEPKPSENPVPPESDEKNLGDEILDLLSKRTKNPSEAFVLMQQLTIFLWDQYNIDWHDKEYDKVAPTRKERYIDFVAGLVDRMAVNVEEEKKEAS
jgi:hypothetical protein